MSNLPAAAPADLYQGIRDLLVIARTQVRQTVNTAMVQTYWQIGRLIVEGEQVGEQRAAYGKQVLPELAKRLTTEFGKGYSASSLWNYRQFYLDFPILATAWRELSWSHFKMMLRVKDVQARTWYATEAVTQGWSVRALDRQISTLFYERLLGSQDKSGVNAKALALIDLKVGKLAHKDVGRWTSMCEYLTSRCAIKERVATTPRRCRFPNFRHQKCLKSPSILISLL